jgi:hypothetical protein
LRESGPDPLRLLRTSAAWLYFKWLRPIDTVNRFDTRLAFDAVVEALTQDKRNVILPVFRLARRRSVDFVGLGTPSAAPTKSTASPPVPATPARTL